MSPWALRVFSDILNHKLGTQVYISVYTCFCSSRNFEKTLKSIPVTMLTTLTRKEEAKYILRVCHTQELASGWSNVSKK